MIGNPILKRSQKNHTFCPALPRQITHHPPSSTTNHRDPLAGRQLSPNLNPRPLVCPVAEFYAGPIRVRNGDVEGNTA